MTVVREDMIGQIVHGIAELGALEYTWCAFLGVMVPANTAKTFIVYSLLTFAVFPHEACGNTCVAY